MDEDNLDREAYTVVVNEEEQYSIWPASREMPPGWKPAGPTGPNRTRPTTGPPLLRAWPRPDPPAVR